MYRSGEQEGVRGGSTHAVEVDALSLFKAEAAIYRSRTGIYLTMGFAGRTPPKYFLRVFEQSTDKNLWRKRFGLAHPTEEG